MHIFKKKIITFFFILISCAVYSKETIKGFVLTQDREAVKDVSVFFNFTTKHTFTNSKGYFELNTEEGSQELIISKPGYVTIKHKIQVSKYITALTFILVKDETYFKPQIKDTTVFNHFLTDFKEIFLGKTAFSKNCVIKNPNVLRFTFDVYRGMLSVRSTAPIIIENNSLGYNTYYDLVNFDYSPEKLSYTGYAYYKEMNNPSDEATKKWKENRELAYQGSRMHFLRSLINKNLEDEGFFIHQFRRIENFDRPSEEEVQRAREIIAENYKRIKFSKRIKNPKNSIDSAVVVIRKISLPKYEDVIYKRRLKYDEMVVENDDNYFIKFKDHLKVVYTKRPEEREYLDFNYFNRSKEPGYQITNINLLSTSILLDKSGTLQEPLDFLMEGYWAFKRIADTLPLDYKSKSNEESK